MGKLNGDSGDSVATRWANMVAAAAAGEVVGIEDKHGNAVAVMVGMDKWEAIVNELERLTNRIELLGGGDT